MRADQYLGQIRQLKRQISRKQSEAVRWRSVAFGISVSTDGDHVQSSGSQDKMAEALSKAVDCENEAASMERAFTAMTGKILDQISGLANPDSSLILEEYYVHGESVGDIAGEWMKTERQIKRVKSAAIREFSEKYGNLF